jgi:hypothetical protein
MPSIHTVPSSIINYHHHLYKAFHTSTNISIQRLLHPSIMSELRQRNVPSKEDAPSVNRPHEGPSDITPAVATPVIVKLLFFTLLLVTVPLSTYFLSLNFVFVGSATTAGALAAVMANVVLVGYLIVAVWDDQGDQADGKPTENVIGKKAQ